MRVIAIKELKDFWQKHNDAKQPIKIKKDYEAALKKIEELFEAKPNAPSRDLLEILTTLVESSEQQHFSISPPDPIEAIKFQLNHCLPKMQIEPAER